MRHAGDKATAGYRREIDGLRALAVLPVILFHAGFSSFGGGYVGVDVFFVISGYLITRLIAAELDAGRFSLWDFYERRARRILPALFAVVLACLPFAWAWMLPAELKNFAQSLVGVALFASNVLFWRETGYFAPAAEEKPLLHTWSLAVEEQYYLAFPLFLMVAWRFGRDPVFYLVAAAALVSLVLAELTVRDAPDAAFYLPHTRAWELLAGSLCALGQRRLSTRAHDGLALLGLALIVGSVFMFDATTPMPSLLALAPVGGAALVVLFAQSGTLAARLLGTPILVGIGLVSYSAYLWHFPLFAFARLRELPIDSAAFMLSLSVLALALGSVTWRFVERPFRHARGRAAPSLLPGRLPIFAASGAMMGALVGIGLAVNATDVRYQRYSPELASVLRGFDDFRGPMRAYGLRTCFIDYDQSADALFANDCLAPPAMGKTDVVLFGDSHAAHLGLGLAESLPADAAMAQYAGTECTPYDHPRLTSRCEAFLTRFIAAMEDRPAGATIVLSANWIAAFEAVGPEAFISAVSTTIERIEASGHRAVLVAQSPSFQTGAWMREVARSGTIASDMRSRSDDFRGVNAALARLATSRGLTLVDPTEPFCAEGSLDCAVRIGGAFVYSDRAHVTPPFSRVIGRLIADALRSSGPMAAAI